MGRLRRLKERKRKNRIKTTACSLALALAIGSAQGIGTHALFTDTEDIANNLTISTGDVDVEIDEGFKLENMEIGKEYESELFEIKNNGTLKQKIYLKFPNSNSFVEKVNCRLELNYKGKTQNVILNDLENLESYREISDFILNHGESITYKFVMEAKNTNKDTKEELKLNLEVLATQIGTLEFNQKNYGFYDIDTQKNTVSIKELAPDETDETIGTCSCGCGNNALKFEFNAQNLDIDEDIFAKFDTVSVFDENSDAMFSPHIFKNSNGKINIDMVFNNEYKNPIIQENLNGRVINMYFTRENVDNQYDKFKVSLSQLEPGKDVIFKWEYQGLVDANKNPITKNQNDIMDNQIQGVIVEDTSKDNIEIQSKPDILEQSKEEVEVPSKPKLVELSKDEEIVVPEQTDTIAQKKE